MPQKVEEISNEAFLFSSSCIYTLSLILERFSFWLKFPNMVAKSQLWALSTKREEAQDSYLAHILGDLSKSEILV